MKTDILMKCGSKELLSELEMRMNDIE